MCTLSDIHEEVLIHSTNTEAFLAGHVVRQHISSACFLGVDDTFPYKISEHRKGIAKVIAIEGDVYSIQKIS